MGVSRDVKEAVLRHINTDEVIELSRQMVAIPSETGSEQGISDFVVGRMQAMGMAARGIAGQPGRPNAVGTWKGKGGGPVVMFSGHMDTVGPGDLKKWITDPYGGEVIDGKIYGRGAMDSKGGGLASTLIALQAVQRAGVPLKGDVLVVGTVDEEVGGYWGMRHLVEDGHINPDLCVYCVHSDMEIKAHFKGIAWNKLTIRGQTAHGSMPHRGVNAIIRAARFYVELERRGIRYQQHPILGDFTMNFGWIHAGPQRKYNVVSDLCELGLDMRLVPGQSSDGVYAELQQILADMKAADPLLDASLERIQSHEPVSVPADDTVLNIVREQAREILGHYPPIGGTIAAGDLAPIFKKGKTGVGFGPGDLERGNAHKENEFLEVDQLVAATKAYALIMLEACGVA